MLFLRKRLQIYLLAVLVKIQPASAHHQPLKKKFWFLKLLFVAILYCPCTWMKEGRSLTPCWRLGFLFFNFFIIILIFFFLLLREFSPFSSETKEVAKMGGEVQLAVGISLGKGRDTRRFWVKGWAQLSPQSSVLHCFMLTMGELLLARAAVEVGPFNTWPHWEGHPSPLPLPGGSVSGCLWELLVGAHLPLPSPTAPCHCCGLFGTLYLTPRACWEPLLLLPLLGA